MRLVLDQSKRRFRLEKLFPAKIRHEDIAGREAAEAYDEWRRSFIRERLHVLILLGLHRESCLHRIGLSAAPRIS